MLRSFERRSAACALGLALVLAAGCAQAPGGKTLRRSKERVFVIGFDGMDPTLSRKWMDEGKLPNLKRLAEEGTFQVLNTTQPSESPTAWASFATGVNPGKHGIYDFLRRDFDTYLPDFNMFRREPPEFLWGFFPKKPARFVSLRGGTSFWVHAANDGVKSVVLTVPLTFPPEDLHHGQMLGGLPLPDMRGTLGTFYYWATDLSSFEEGNTEFGGFLKRLLLEDGTAVTVLKGPENPILKEEEVALKKKKEAGLTDQESARLEELATGKDVNLPMTVRWKEGSGRADIEIQGQKLSLKAGEWSPWVPLTFKINMLVRVHGMTQFYVGTRTASSGSTPLPSTWTRAGRPSPSPSPTATPPSWRVRSASSARSAGRSRRTSRSTRAGSTRRSSSTTPTGPWTTASASSSRA